MGCSDGREIDCADALRRVYLFLDGEIPADDAREARKHLDECTPCLVEYGLEEEVKRLVYRSCRNEPAPENLRAKVMVRIEQITVELRNS